jgi:pimeloyl-ACP methyl ester carboxylesterase
VPGRHRQVIASVAASLLALVAGCGEAPAAELVIVPDYRDNPAIETTDLSYANGDVTIAASLLVPQGAQPDKAVVLLPGSGFSSRDNRWAGMMAQLVANFGVAVLFPDKRGAGESTGGLATSEFTDLADDAIAGVRTLKQRAGSGPAWTRVGLIGLSQGGRVAPLAAVRAGDAVDFVINISGGATDGLESLRHERPNTYREMGIEDEWLRRFTRCDAIVDRILTTGEGREDYLDCVEEFGGGPYAEFAARVYPTDPGDWRLSWFTKVVAYAPMEYWPEVRQPVFVAYGKEDEYENVPVMRSTDLLRRAFERVDKENYRIEVYPGVGHALWQERDGHYEFHADFVADLGEWLNAR